MDKFKYPSLLLIFSIFITHFFITPEKAFADVIAEDECFPAVLMLRGSGETVTPLTYRPVGSTADFLKTNGNEGPILSGLLQEFVNETNPAETVSKVRFIGIDYPALPVIPEIPKALTSATTPESTAALVYSLAWMNHIIQYNSSYRAGAQKTVDFIKEDQRRGCETQYMLLSYSQGVIAARLAINLLNNQTDKIISSYVIGDPFQKPNGATSSNQKSNANTSSDTMGSPRIFSKILALAGSGEGSSELDGSLLTSSKGMIEFLGAPTVGWINNYTNEITNADPVIYRDEGSEGIVSRALCHIRDPTCGIDINNPLYNLPLNISIEQHTNYFDPGVSHGRADILYEVSEFDKQVKKLAESEPSSPRQRILTKSASIDGQVTTYNVANARPDDKCYWDKDSDGTIDSTMLPDGSPSVSLDFTCKTFNTVHDSAPNMTVKIIDSFGIGYTRNLETQSVDPTIIASAVGLNPNNTYQFNPYIPLNDGEVPYPGLNSCISYYAQENQPMYDGYGFQLRECIDMSEEATTFNNWPQTYKVFSNKIVMGNDESYSWQNHYTLRIIKSSFNEDQNIKVDLIRFINGVPYYSFRNGDRCLMGAKIMLAFIPCDTKDMSQLFSARPVYETSNNR
jgi:hypothetical protein